MHQFFPLRTLTSCLSPNALFMRPLQGVGLSPIPPTSALQPRSGSPHLAQPYASLPLSSPSVSSLLSDRRAFPLLPSCGHNDIILIVDTMANRRFRLFGESFPHRDGGVAQLAASAILPRRFPVGIIEEDCLSHLRRGNATCSTSRFVPQSCPTYAWGKLCSR